jgi:hypothetical protein
MDPDAFVARVWHEGAVVRQVRLERISKNLSEQYRMGADDGNRTRMTSLEGWGSTIELHPRDASATGVTGSLPGRAVF